MNSNRHLAMTLIAAAILSACSSIPKNTSLDEAHVRFNEARNSPQISNLAAVELKEAEASLLKADQALSSGESEASVNHLAYVARQRVRVAQETAARKASEAAVANAESKRNQVRLDARTAEADTAKQKAASAQATVEQQATQLAVASAASATDQATIAKQEQQLKELNAKKTDRGLVITLGDVLFATNKSELKSGGSRTVQKLADFLNQYPKHRVLIEGYTDSTGSDATNQMLSERRADAVRAELVHLGIASGRIMTRGYGKQFPVADNNSSTNRQLNRRVEIILSDESGNVSPR